MTCLGPGRFPGPGTSSDACSGRVAAEVLPVLGRGLGRNEIFQFARSNNARISELLNDGIEIDGHSVFTPLKKLPLVSLDATGTEFKDLTILRGMKLTTLQLRGCRQVRDLRPLAGMPLADLTLDGTSMDDLAPLAGMPLNTLHLAGCEKLEDLRPLTDLRQLGALYIQDCMRVKNLAPLRGLRLHHLDFRPQFITEGSLPASCSVCIHDLRPNAEATLCRASQSSLTTIRTERRGSLDSNGL